MQPVKSFTICPYLHCLVFHWFLLKLILISSYPFQLNIHVIFEGEKEFEQKISLWGVSTASSWAIICLFDMIIKRPYFQSKMSRSLFVCLFYHLFVNSILLHLPLFLLGDRCEQEYSKHDGRQDRDSHEEVRGHVMGSSGPPSPCPPTQGDREERRGIRQRGWRMMRNWNKNIVYFSWIQVTRSIPYLF